MARLHEGPKFVHLFLYLSVVVCCFTSAASEDRILDESNWREVLEGEWMVKFYAPWCPACTALEPAWKELSVIAEREGLAMRTASVDVTKSPGLSGRFIVTALPTIFHVHSGEFRAYKGARDAASLAEHSRRAAWRRVDPVPAWKAPDSVQMTLVAEFFKLSQALRSVHTMLMETYGLPTWGSYLIFAVGTIFAGSLLGLMLVCLIDMLYPPRRPARADPLAAGDDAAKSDDEGLLQEDLVDESDSEREKHSQSDSSGAEASPDPAAEQPRRRRPRKAD